MYVYEREINRQHPKRQKKTFLKIYDKFFENNLLFSVDNTIHKSISAVKNSNNRKDKTLSPRVIQIICFISFLLSC